MLGFQIQGFFDIVDSQLFSESESNSSAIDAMRVLRVQRDDISTDFVELFQRTLEQAPKHDDNSLLSRRLCILSLNAEAFSAASMSANFAQALSSANMGPYYQQHLQEQFTQIFIAGTLRQIVQTLNQLLSLAGILPGTDLFAANTAAND